jgi:hypothetical protein
MKFIVGKKYIDRADAIYTFREKVSGVTKFEDETGNLTCRNENGLYRWDDKQLQVDIVSEYIE